MNEWILCYVCRRRRILVVRLMLVYILGWFGILFSCFLMCILLAYKLVTFYIKFLIIKLISFSSYVFVVRFIRTVCAGNWGIGFVVFGWWSGVEWRGWMEITLKWGCYYYNTIYLLSLTSRTANQWSCVSFVMDFMGWLQLNRFDYILGAYNWRELIMCEVFVY